MSETCKVCKKRPSHGYVIGTGEYLDDTCLICFRRRRSCGDIIIEGGDSRRGSKIKPSGLKEE